MSTRTKSKKSKKASRRSKSREKKLPANVIGTPLDQDGLSDKEIAAKQEERKRHVEKIWKLFEKSNEDQRRKILEQLDEDTINELRSQKSIYNPENTPYLNKKGNRILLCSIFSPLEKYIDRFSMTSLVGFIYRMMDEYTPEEAKKYMSENDPEFAKLYGELRDKFEKDKPCQVWNHTLETLAAEKDLLAAKLKITEEDAKEVNDVDAADDIELSDDESDDLDADEIKTRISEIEREIMEIGAKIAIHTISTYNAELKEMQPALKSLQKDVERQKEVRKAIKDTIRKFKLEKVKAGQQAEVDAGENDADDNLSADEEVVEEVVEEAPEASASDEEPEAAQKIAGARRKQKRKKVSPALKDVKLRDVNEIRRDLRRYGDKLIANKDDLAEAETKLADHEKTMTSLETERDAMMEKFVALKQEYFNKYGNPNKRDASPSRKSKKNEVTKVGGRRTRAGKVSKEKSKSGVEYVFDHLTFEECKVTEEDEYYIKEDVKKALNIKMTQEECSDTILDNIQEFLDHYLVYNPDNHVRSGYRPNYPYVDPTRNPVEPPKRDPESGMIIDKNFERFLIPPEDTFKRWERYREANYEQLRQATDDIYCEKSDFEWCIVPHEIFTGENAEEKAREWERKHSKEVDYSIRSVTFNKNNLLGPWEQNREAVNFYTKETEIIKRILDSRKEEERMGKDLMKDRINKKKEENEEKHGKLDPGLDSHYRQSGVANDLEKYGAKRLAAEDIPRDEHDLADDEVEVNVFNIGATRKGRRWKPTMNEWKFHLPAKPLEEGQVITHTPAEYQEKMKKEKKDE